MMLVKLLLILDWPLRIFGAQEYLCPWCLDKQYQSEALYPWFMKHVDQLCPRCQHLERLGATQEWFREHWPNHKN